MTWFKFLLIDFKLAHSLYSHGKMKRKCNLGEGTNVHSIQCWISIMQCWLSSVI